MLGQKMRIWEIVWIFPNVESANLIILLFIIELDEVCQQSQVDI